MKSIFFFQIYEPVKVAVSNNMWGRSDSHRDRGVQNVHQNSNIMSTEWLETQSSRVSCWNGFRMSECGFCCVSVWGGGPGVGIGSERSVIGTIPVKFSTVYYCLCPVDSLLLSPSTRQSLFSHLNPCCRCIRNHIKPALIILVSGPGSLLTWCRY